MKQFVLLFLVVSFVHAQEEFPGTKWRGFSRETKVQRLVGFTEGIFAAGDILRYSGTSSDCMVSVYKVLRDLPRTEITQSIDAMDRFYEDPANRKISMGSAYAIFLLQLGGTSEGELKRIIEEERSLKNKVEQEFERSRILGVEPDNWQ